MRHEKIQDDLRVQSPVPGVVEDEDGVDLDRAGIMAAVGIAQCLVSE